MARYLANDLVAFLIGRDCSFDGDVHDHGTGWSTPDGQIFMLPDPDATPAGLYYDAEVVDDIFANRWVGFSMPLPLTRYS